MLSGLLAHPVAFNSLILLASLFVIYKSADLLVLGISDYARKLGLSDAIIGMVVVAMAASLPEIVSALTGFANNQVNIGIGTILGTNMVHAAFALGALTFLTKKIRLKKTIFSRQRLLLWLILMLPFVLATIGEELSRIDGTILIAAFLLYLTLLWKKEGTLGKLKKNVKLKTIWRDATIFLGCLLALMLSGKWLVFSAINIAHAFSIPAYFIALTIIGIGTTLPDIAVELRAINKHPSIGMGDLLGSLMIELLLFFGIVALISPIPLAHAGNALFFLATAISLLVLWLDQELTWKHGLAFLTLYFLFLAIEIWKVTQT